MAGCHYLSYTTRSCSMIILPAAEHYPPFFGPGQVTLLDNSSMCATTIIYISKLLHTQRIK